MLLDGGGGASSTSAVTKLVLGGGGVRTTHATCPLLDEVYRKWSPSRNPQNSDPFAVLPRWFKVSRLILECPKGPQIVALGTPPLHAPRAHRTCDSPLCVLAPLGTAHSAPPYTQCACPSTRNCSVAVNDRCIQTKHRWCLLLSAQARHPGLSRRTGGLPKHGPTP